MSSRRSAVVVAAALSLLACGVVSSQAQPIIAPPPPAQPAGIAPLPAPPAKVVEIPLEKAKPLTSDPGVELKPVPLKLEGKLQGWAITIPGGKPIATPAYDDGKLFVGGGYGSYEFYAFDAQTGKLAWQYHTNDDGPTAAVVEDGCVAFNTESCTVYVLDEKTGKCLWNRWLGDPLMSQPAISKGRLFMAYPAGQRSAASHVEGTHALMCADLKTGKELWNKPISADVISAPIVEYDRVYATCMDGTSYCFSAASGDEIWTKKGSYTSAPLVCDGKLIVAEKQEENGHAQECLRRVDADKGQLLDKRAIASAPAPYMERGKSNGAIGPQSFDARSHYAALDSSVGFGSYAYSDEGSPSMSSAYGNMGLNSVAGAWGYQGARGVYRDGKVTNSQLVYVNNVDAASGKLNWKAEAKGSFITGQTQVFSPPSLGKQNMYLCSGDGHIVCLNQKDGSVQYMYKAPASISFQPALANGNIYIGTGDGRLLCVQAQDADADGWSAWGGNAQHNKNE